MQALMNLQGNTATSRVCELSKDRMRSLEIGV